MADIVAFQNHHVIEQQAFRDSPLLQKLNQFGLFEVDDQVYCLHFQQDLGLRFRPAGKAANQPKLCELYYLRLQLHFVRSFGRYHLHTESYAA